MPGFVTCGPNEVLVISGCCHSKPYLMPGGRVFVWPWFQMMQKISLNTMTLTIQTPDVYTKEGVPISLTGIAQVKVNSNNAEMISLACEHFLCKTEVEIVSIVEETLEGHQREIMASMTVESIYQDRKHFSKQVYQVASSGLSCMGLTVVSYTVKDIIDEFGYLRSLGEASTAAVKKDAMVGETEALKETQLKQTEADEMKQSSALQNEIKTAESRYKFQEKKYTYDREVCEKRAEADFATELQRVETRNKILTKKLEVQLKESELQVELAKSEMERTKLQFEIDVHKLADAEYSRAKILADAHKQKIELEAAAEAEAVQLRGSANAYMIEKTGIAENEMLAKKADALKDFNAAARMDMILEALPKVAAEIAEPLSRCSKITMVSQGEGEVGANKLTNEILEIMSKVQFTVDKMGASQTASDAGGDESRRGSSAATLPTNPPPPPPSGGSYSDARRSMYVPLSGSRTSLLGKREQ